MPRPRSPVEPRRGHELRRTNFSIKSELASVVGRLQSDGMAFGPARLGTNRGIIRMVGAKPVKFEVRGNLSVKVPDAFGVRKKVSGHLIGTIKRTDEKRTRMTYWYANRRKKKGSAADRGK